MPISESQRIKEVYQRRQDGIRYSPFNPAQIYIIQQQEREVMKALIASGFQSGDLERLKIFEVGCGSGYNLRKFVLWGAKPENCSGMDIRQEVVVRGRQISPDIQLYEGDCRAIPLPDNSQGLVFQNVVFSSVLDAEIRQTIAKEMVRITAPGGIILWYDLRMDNPYNQDVVGIKWDELSRLFNPCLVSFCSKALLAPPLARKIAPFSTILCDLLYKVPFLRSHFVATFIKK